MIFKIAFRSIFRNTRRSLTTMLTIATLDPLVAPQPGQALAIAYDPAQAVVLDADPPDA